MVLILFFCELYFKILPRNEELWGKKLVLNWVYSHIKYFYSTILQAAFQTKTDFIGKLQGYGINLRSIYTENDYSDGNSSCSRLVLTPSKSTDFLPLIFVLDSFTLLKGWDFSLVSGIFKACDKKKMEWNFLENVSP